MSVMLASRSPSFATAIFPETFPQSAVKGSVVAHVDGPGRGSVAVTVGVEPDFGNPSWVSSLSVSTILSKADEARARSKGVTAVFVTVRCSTCPARLPPRRYGSG